MADQKLTALTELSVPALEDLLYGVDDPAGTPASVKLSLARVGGLLLAPICQGRLTLESGVPVSITDQTAKTSVYFTPFNGNRIAVYDGTRWKLYAFSELTLALGTITSGKNYDVFVYDNAGTLTLELSAAWTNDSTRADAITTQDGIHVKNGATTRRLLGTIRTTSTTTTEDSKAKRFVSNLYNRLRRSLYISSTSSHTYNSTTWRGWNNADIRYEWVDCDRHTLEHTGQAVIVATASYPAFGLGVDWTSSTPGTFNLGAPSSALTDGPGIIITPPAVELAAGYHYVRLVEALLTGSTSSTYTRADMSGTIFG